MSQSDHPIEQWAENVIREWEDRMIALDIYKTGELFDSLVKHVDWASDGNPEMVQFFFNYYGKFVDWGVGNGVDLVTKNILISAGLTNRRPKKWIYSIFYQQLGQLQAQLSEHLARRAKFMIINKFTEMKDIEMNI